jgi:hypothetical protein
MIDNISLVAVPADTTAAVLLVRYLVEVLDPPGLLFATLKV